LAHSVKKIQEHLQKMNAVELCWVRRSANGLADIIANEGVSKEGSELDTTWRNILNGQFKTNSIQLATKYSEGRLSMKGHIERSGRRLIGGHDESKQNLHGQHLIKNENAGSYHTIDGGMTSRSHQ
jgi:hypothetical protein